MSRSIPVCSAALAVAVAVSSLAAIASEPDRQPTFVPIDRAFSKAARNGDDQAMPVPYLTTIRGETADDGSLRLSCSGDTNPAYRAYRRHLEARGEAPQ